ncbi:MAG: glycoside hydrolase family 88 protein [Verrucomicrobiota bacterium]
MRRLPFWLALAFATACPAATPLEWSVRMADSEMARRGDSLSWKQGGAAKWDYTTGLFALALLDLQRCTTNPAYGAWAERTIGSFIAPDGSIHGYKPDEFQLDHLNPGKAVLRLYDATRDPKYLKAAERLRAQLGKQPRTADGGFWHKQRYTNQMWLDGLYMGGPFYAECAVRFHEPASSMDDVARQFLVMAGHAYSTNAGLLYHGWDEKRAQAWADPVTGLSSNFWGRAVGWYAMGLVDALDFVPTNHAKRPELLGLLTNVCSGIRRWQDPKSGLWWQVLDQPGRDGNYLEATASAMFVYAIAKGVNRGWLDRAWLPVAARGYEGLQEDLVREDAGGGLSLTRCCSVAGLGFGRDGSYAYYLREPVVDNDLKGIGPFILAGWEMQSALGLPCGSGLK